MIISTFILYIYVVQTLLFEGQKQHKVSILKSLLEAQSPMSELLSPRWSKWSEGRWLQLICCALPKCLYP